MREKEVLIFGASGEILSLTIHVDLALSAEVTDVEIDLVLGVVQEQLPGVAVFAGGDVFPHPGPLEVKWNKVSYHFSLNRLSIKARHSPQWSHRYPSDWPRSPQ
jgi:hypothetical protein